MMDVVLRLIYFGGSGMFVRMICVACTFLTDADVNLKFNGHINSTFVTSISTFLPKFIIVTKS